MAGIQDLTVEILMIIFDLAIAVREPDYDCPETSSCATPGDGPAILNLALTCSRFRDVVEQVKFRYLFQYDASPLKADDMKRFGFMRNPVNWSRGLRNALQRNRQLGNQCRELGVNMIEDQFAGREEFLRSLEEIVPDLPNMTKLWIGCSFKRTTEMQNTLYPRLLDPVKNMSRLVTVAILTVDHIRELDSLYSIQWPSSVRKLHLGITSNLKESERDEGQPMLRGECNITSLSIADIQNLLDFPSVLEGFPNALEELTLLDYSRPTAHIPFSMRFDRHKHSLRALSLVFSAFGVPSTLNVSDCTALEHLSLHYRELRYPDRLGFVACGDAEQFAARILGPILKRLTWVFHYENEPGLLETLSVSSHYVRERLHRELAVAAGERAAALEEIHVIWVPRKDFKVQYPDPVKAIVVDKLNLSEKVTLTYSAAGMPDETRLEVSRALRRHRA
ncbi:hypothetical protein H634G_08869 [Metarhizium anisopliae BRIP 53293]|uniref:F-box domain-containing protein n=1 Tax=Metarhizium anisopliae BRIP 53293 TaxID=1291518 RepID=A0A0D9NNM7_METAN|nr:hypothetical protein H634G_08869 [Metarhizium anisopliae BRIP 53293]KJK95402.1 hypothetical protein H633G_00692 [Metarhizium anisopliae BRIP 53284]